MTPILRNTFIRKVKNISISSSLALALLGNTAMLQSCGSSSSEDEYEEIEEVEAYTKGVKTYISETSKGEFKITNEEIVTVDSSQAIVKYLDGREERLSAEAAKNLIDYDIANNQTSIGQNNSLSNALLFGGMGFLLAKTMSPNYVQYRPEISSQNTGYNANNSTNKKDTVRHRSHHSGLGSTLGFIMMSRYFMNSGVMNRSSGIYENISQSRTTAYRPVNSKSGFFRGTGRTSFRA
jgi:hypothetical protein